MIIRYEFVTVAMLKNFASISVDKKGLESKSPWSRLGLEARVLGRGVYTMLTMKQFASLTSQGGIEKWWCFWVQGGKMFHAHKMKFVHTLLFAVQPASNIVFCERNHQPTIRQTAFLLYKLTVSIKKALGRPTRRGFSWCDDPPPHPAPFVRLQSVAAATSAARLGLQSGPLVLWDWDNVVSGRILDFLK